jgi:SAM-dependent methyltransferase
MRSRAGVIIALLKARQDPNQILVRLALRNALLGCESVLDVGCGVTQTMRYLGVPKSVGAEGYAPAFEEAKRQGTHDQLVKCDVRNLSSEFKAGQFDACVALDVIEHLTKEDGLKLMADMERIAKKKVIFFTPSGFLPQRHASSDDLQEHLSGWEASEMERLGYRTTGALGPKSLRGEYHLLKRRPAFFWGTVSLIRQLMWSKSHPAQAAAILCVKTHVQI